MSTRIVVKNLPSWITAEKLREVFEQKGNLTDCSVKYNSSGKSRRFAFIGYPTAEQATAAIEYFNNTCIGTSRVRVEECKSLTESATKGSGSEMDKDTRRRTPRENNHIPEDVSLDPKFAEFIRLHQHGDNVWENDLPSKLNPEKASGNNTAKADVSHSESKAKPEDIVDPSLSDAYACIVKLKNLSFNVSKEQIKQFFCGLDIRRVMFGVKKLKPGENSVVYVEFVDAKSAEQALRRNKSFLCGKKVLIAKVFRQLKSSGASSAIVKKTKFSSVHSKVAVDVTDSGRLFVRNLSYLCSEEDIQELFSKFGELSEVYLPLEKITKRNKGFAFVSYLMPEHAVKALNELDGTCFQGRMLHIIPAEGKPETEKVENAGSSFKSNKEASLRGSASSSHNWNALFVGGNAVIDSIASDYGAEKKQLFEQAGAAVRMALGETEIVLKTKKFLEDHGVHLEAFGKPVVKRSKTIILVKNLPARTQLEELRNLFEKFGVLSRLVLPPSGVTALIEYSDNNEARAAFRALAYRRFKDLPLYLEWAPVDTFSENAPLLRDIATSKPEPSSELAAAAPTPASAPAPAPVAQTPAVEGGCATIFVKNLNFKTSEECLLEHFSAKFPGKVVRCTIAKNKDGRKQMMSLGYGFVEFLDTATALDVLKQMQHSELDDHKLDLKISTSKVTPKTSSASRKQNDNQANEPSSRILVRNIPFEANTKDIQELFAVFGSLRSVRLPKKAILQSVGTVSGRSGGGRSANLHRGFGFVEFHSVEEAKRAFDALRYSTHFYGRRLVLEWAKTDETEIVDELRAKAAERAVASAAAAAGAVHAGVAKRLRKGDVVASVENMANKVKEDDDGGID